MSDQIGDRMKAYENAYRITLPRRLPVLLRIDGKAFHTLTKRAERPFDAGLADAMVNAAKAICEEIQGAQLAYVQSDEISVLVHNYKTLDTEPWFGNNLQKMVSVSASTAAANFDWRPPGAVIGEIRPAFDARAWVLPEAEVCNYFIWRQQDATRNSIQMLARSMFSANECHKKNQDALQEMCWQKGHNWNDLPTRWRRGVCVLREAYAVDGVPRHQWSADLKIPIFTRDRQYIERHLAVETGTVAAVGGAP